MYEHCPEAYALYLRAQDCKDDFGPRGESDDSGERFYLNAAEKSWKAHKMGKCTCALRRILSEALAKQIQ